MWTDSHCHLDYEGVAAGAVAEAEAAGVTRLISVGTDVAHSRAAIAIAAEHPQVWATVGVHPHEASAGTEGVEALLSEPKVVAVGECGLDYHYDHSPRDVQRRVFAEHVRLAHAHRLALVVHSRSAWDDTFAVLESEGVPARTVFHCFTGGPDEAARALELGAYLSFSGIVTFKNAADVRAAAGVCPLDRMLVETDAPYLAPVPHRGQPNQPAYASIVGQAVAELRGLPAPELAALTTASAERLFEISQIHD